MSNQVEPGGARTSQEQPGAAQAEPGGTKMSQEEPRKSLEEPGGARRSQGGAQEEPGEARRSQKEPGGAQEQPRKETPGTEPPCNDFEVSRERLTSTFGLFSGEVKPRRVLSLAMALPDKAFRLMKGSSYELRIDLTEIQK